jgi:hypothetical protein
MENLLSQAKTWRFLVENDSRGNWQILPPTKEWKLQQTEDRWLLTIGNVPQVRLCSNEAVAFLKRRLFVKR